MPPPRPCPFVQPGAVVVSVRGAGVWGVYGWCMTIPVSRLSDPTVRAFVTALNANDRDAFAAVLAAGATMSDDGSERDLGEWTEREIFSSNGRMEVEGESEGGRVLVATYSNDTWGAMRTAWRFDVEGGKVKRFETGQAPAD